VLTLLAKHLQNADNDISSQSKDIRMTRTSLLAYLSLVNPNNNGRQFHRTCLKLIKDMQDSLNFRRYNPTLVRTAMFRKDEFI